MCLCVQACSLVVSSLPGNPLSVWKGVGLRIAECTSMHMRERKLHSARAHEYVYSKLCTYILIIVCLSQQNEAFIVFRITVRTHGMM